MDINKKKTRSKFDSFYICWDDSWSKIGGIGKFSDEIKKRLPIDREIRVNCNPASPKVPFLLRKILSKDQSTINFLPGYIPPIFFNGNYTLTIHDLNHIDRTENSSFLKKLFYKFIIRRGVRKARHIFTVSEFSQQRIIDWFGIEKDKITVVYNGVDNIFNMNVKPFKFESPYFLCVSNRKIHKNEFRLIEAFLDSDIDKNVRLIFTGKRSLELDKLIKDRNGEDRIIFIGYIDEDELPSLYKASIALLFPSLYEGFGIPVIEAMACGVPVLTSNTTSLFEIAKDAAVLVNPENKIEIQRGITELYHNQQLREGLIQKGIERVKLFSWEKAADLIKQQLNLINNNELDR